MSMNHVTACTRTSTKSTPVTTSIPGVAMSARKPSYADSPWENRRSMYRRISPYAAAATPPSSRIWKTRYRGFRSHQPAGRFQGYRRGCGIVSPRGPGQEELPHLAERREDLQALDRGRGVDLLWADDGTLADERALPDPRLRGQAAEPRVRALVAGVPDVPVREGGGRGPDEVLAPSEHGARRIAQHAVDAHALLPVGLDLLGRLQILAFGQGLRLLPHDVRLDALELPEEVVVLHDEVLDHGKVGHRVDRDQAAIHVLHERPAREDRPSVHVRAAGSADPHPAGPAERERGVEVVLDVVQAVEDDGIVPERDFVVLVARPSLGLGPVAEHPEHDLPVRHVSTPSPRAATA